MIPLENLVLSAQKVHIEKDSAILTLQNIHKTLKVGFKIKVSILDVLEVKPAIGYIEPNGLVAITITKPKVILSSTKNPQATAKLPKINKLLIATINIAAEEDNKEKITQLWSLLKDKKLAPPKCGEVFVPISFEGVEAAEDYRSSAYRSEVNSLKGVSPSKSNTKSQITAQQSIFASSNAPPSDPKRDQELAKQYEELRRKEETLLKQRNAVATQGSATKSGQTPKKSSKVLGLYLLFLVIGFLVGNYLRCKYTHEL